MQARNTETAMDGHMMDGLGTLITALAVICAISVPLGLWKLAELIGWAAGHVSVSVH